MQRIPNEVIDEILKVSGIPIIQAHHARGFPWSLGQICSSWRDAFISATWIWRKFFIHLGPETESNLITLNLEAILHIVEMCLERSDEQPLTFSIKFTSKPWPEYGQQLESGQQHVERLLSALLSQSYRWQDVELDCGFFDLEEMRAVFSNRPSSLPLLRSLKLLTWKCTETPEFSELLRTAPCLSQLEVDYHVNWNFDWTKMTALFVHHALNDGELVPILGQLKSIERLEVPGLVIFATRSLCPLVSLPHLKILRAPIELMRHFRAPRLEELQLDHIHVPRGPLPEAVKESFGQSSYNLKRLILGSQCLLEPDIESILRQAPHVTHLCLKNDINLSNLLPYNSEKRAPILPQLEFLFVTDEYLRRLDNIVTLCLSMSSRTNRVNLQSGPHYAGKLKALRIIGRTAQHLSDIKKLCQTLGIKFSVCDLSRWRCWCSDEKKCKFELCNPVFVMRGLYRP